MTPTIERLNQQIAGLELERMQLPQLDPDRIEREIQELAARAIPGIEGAEKALAALQKCIANKDLAVQYQARRIEIDNELRGLRIERDAEIADQARQELEQMNREFDQAAAEFDMLVKNMCRQYRRLARINTKNASRNPRFAQRALVQFNFPGMNPYGWQANTSQLVLDGVFPWLKEDN